VTVKDKKLNYGDANSNAKKSVECMSASVVAIVCEWCAFDQRSSLLQAAR